MTRELYDYVKDILDSTDDVEIFIREIDFDEFREDRKTVYAVIRAIEIMGEAVKNIPNPIKEKHPEIPWKQIAGMRDKLIHGYFVVDMMTLWKTATQDVPRLKSLIADSNIIEKESLQVDSKGGPVPPRG